MSNINFRLVIVLFLVGGSGAFAEESFFQVLPASPMVPKDNPITPAKIELGKKLYFDPRLSVDGTVSCNSCHNVMGSGTDDRPHSVGIKGQTGDRGAPTVWNSAFMTVQFWDGRAPSLEEQAKGPLTNPIEMGMPNHDRVVKRLQKIPGYVAEFKNAFPKEKRITIDLVAKAIATYERTLITPNSPFDRYLKGDKKAVSEAAIRGSKTVQEVGCTSCHYGPNYAGESEPMGEGFFRKFPTFEENVYVKKYDLMKDVGRFKVTNNEDDKHHFRVQTWRNIALTAPYFHVGTVKTLDEAVRVMAKTQLDVDLKPNQVSDIVAFLESLTGEFPKQEMPQLPPAKDATWIDQ